MNKIKPAVSVPQSMRVPGLMAAALAAGFMPGAGSAAAPLPVGSSFPLTATGASRNGDADARPDGSYVACAMLAGSGVIAQLLQSDGTPAGPPIAVSGAQSTLGGPRVAADGAGRFLVVFAADGTSGVDDELHGRWFGADGSPEAPEFTIYTPPTGADRLTGFDLAVNAGGEAVVVRSTVTASAESPARPQHRIVAQRIDSTGASDAEILVKRQRGFIKKIPLDGLATGGIFLRSGTGEPAVDMDDDGDFVVGWTGTGGVYVEPGYTLLVPNAEAASSRVYVRRYSADDVASPEQLVTVASRRNARSALAMDEDGDFIVTWPQHTPHPNDSASQVWSRRYRADGRPRNLGRAVTLSTPGEVKLAPVAVRPGGGYVVTWAPVRAGIDAFDVQARSFDAAGRPDSVPFTVHEPSVKLQYEPAVAVGANGRMLFTWTDLDADVAPAERFIGGRLFDPAPE